MITLKRIVLCEIRLKREIYFVFRMKSVISLNMVVIMCDQVTEGSYVVGSG